MKEPASKSMGRREFMGVSALVAASVGVLPNVVARPNAPVKSKRDLMLQVLDKSATSNYVPASFFLHFPTEQRTGDVAVKAHLDYFRATGMDFVKIQFEQSYPKAVDVKNAARKVRYGNMPYEVTVARWAYCGDSSTC